MIRSVQSVQPFVAILSVAFLAGCGATKEAFSPERIQRSKETYGRQQQSGENTNRTSAEQAAVAHDTQGKPKNPDSEENKE